MATLTDEILVAVKDLDEDRATLLKWETIRRFIETNEMTKKNREEIGAATILWKEGDKDPYCKKYVGNDCKGCPIAEYGGAPCYEIPCEGGGCISGFANPFGDLQDHLDHLLDCDEKEFLEDFGDEGKNLKGEILSAVDEIIDFLKKSIESKKSAEIKRDVNGEIQIPNNLS